MKALVLALCALLATGCGDDEKEKEPSIVGTVWHLNATKMKCTITFWFTKDGRYKNMLVCALKNGLLGTQIEEGWWATDRGRLDLTPQLSTCPDDTREPTSYAYEFSGENLVLSSPNFLSVFTPSVSTDAADGSNGGVSFTNGCFDDEYVFSESPLTDI